MNKPEAWGVRRTADGEIVLWLRVEEGGVTKLSHAMPPAEAHTLIRALHKAIGPVRGATA